jgi:hypothetical protein
MPVPALVILGPRIPQVPRWPPQRPALTLLARRGGPDPAPAALRLCSRIMGVTSGKAAESELHSAQHKLRTREVKRSLPNGFSQPKLEPQHSAKESTNES